MGFLMIRNFENTQEKAEVFGLALSMFIILTECLNIFYHKNNIMEVEEMLRRRPFIPENQDEEIIRNFYGRITKSVYIPKEKKKKSILKFF